MKRYFYTITAMIITTHVLTCIAFAGSKVLKMSTTTSTQTSGLLDILLPEFESDTGIRVKVFAKGTGAAIRDGIDGNVDVIFVHDRVKEEKFINDGYGIKRYAVMHNDFVILGPGNDPAGIKGMKDAVSALKKIAAAQARFISRGDDSGTHAKEQFLWKASGLVLGTRSNTLVKKGRKKIVRFVYPIRSEKWYLSVGQGMGKTITFCDEKKAYTLADKGTYIKYKYGRALGLDLEIMCEGDVILLNSYGVIPISPAKHPYVEYSFAKQFAQWLISTRGQSLIANYKLLGKQLFYPDAIK